MRWIQPFVWAGCLLAFTLSAAFADRDVGADEQTLRDAHIKTDGPSLLEFFRKRTLSESAEDKIKRLIRQLGDDSFELREKASRELVELGNLAERQLREALKDPDVEIVRRAERCLEQIRSGAGAAVPIAAVRLIARKKPAGTVDVLLGYLPCAENDLVAEQVRKALADLAVQDGKADQALVAALTDKSPLRRAAAAEALIRAGNAETRPAVRKLLQDPDAAVRMRVALALAAAKERQAIAVLIQLLGELPRNQAWQVEDLLCRLAEDQAPAVPVGDDELSRKKCRDAWAAWWDKHGAKIDLAKLDKAPQLRGYTLMVLLDRGIMFELDNNDKLRWQIEGLGFPLDAQVLPGDRVLVAEQTGNRVTERNLKGEVLWEKQVDGPLMAQRLANGNTFIATRSQLLEMNRDGKQVVAHDASGTDYFMKALKLPNGDIACVVGPVSPRYVRLDSTGKERKSFPVNLRTSGGRIDVLPNGRVLVPEMAHNRVVEYDADGKAVWQVTIDQPVAAVRLPNGNTLITTMTQNRAVEVNREGKEVWQYKTDTRVTRAFRR